MNGQTIESFKSGSGLITSLIYDENDLIITSFNSFIMRWTLSSNIHQAILEKNFQNSPIIDLFTDEILEKKNLNGGNILNNDTIKNNICLFEGINDQPIKPDKIILNDNIEINNDTNFLNNNNVFDLPRPSIVGTIESKVDNIVRASYVFSKENFPNKKENNNKIEEINKTTDDFCNIITKIKELLIYTPQNIEEENALKELKLIFEEFQKESLKSDWFPELMGSLMTQFFDYVKKH